MISRICFALALTAPLVACTEASSVDELDIDDATEGDDSKADISTGTYTYYFVQPDYRRCASPYCGGVFYRLANATKTTCVDGTKAERCYAASADWSKLGLGAVGQQKVFDALNTLGGEVLTRSTIARRDWGKGLGRFAHLNPREAWIAQGPGPGSGVVAKVEPTGVRCFTTPCPFFRERKLNSSLRADLGDLDWTAAQVSDELVSTALDRMHFEGLIIAGSRFPVTGPGGTMPGRTVSQFWLRANDEAPDAPASECRATGCSGQICADEDMFSTCEYRPEYACYQSATCERQTDGQCGWTPTPALQACLANPPQP
jgi:eight-cysteine-cluster-containing protein